MIYSLYAFDTPAKNPRISQKERIYIENSLKKEVKRSKVSNQYGRWNIGSVTVNWECQEIFGILQNFTIFEKILSNFGVKKVLFRLSHTVTIRHSSVNVNKQINK